MIEPTNNVSSDNNRKKEIVTTGEVNNSVSENSDHYNPTVREVNIPKLANGSCGFDLSRSKWDPYPWVINFLSFY